jgi:hypothetical protein
MADIMPVGMEVHIEVDIIVMLVQITIMEGIDVKK